MREDRGTVRQHVFVINRFVTNGFSHPYHLDESTFMFRGIRNNF